MNWGKSATIVAVGLLIVGLSVSEYLRYLGDGRTKALEERLTVAESDAQAALKAVISPNVLSNADKSVYMVTIDKAMQDLLLLLTVTMVFWQLQRM